MDIRVNNLDLGYEQCSELSKFINNNGHDLMAKISNNINNLKMHWIGNDAMVHINNLIELDEMLGKLINGALDVTHNAAESMIKLQTIRQMNGGNGEIGSSLPIGTDFNTIARVQSTTEYYVEPSSLNDLVTLKEIHSDYQNFIRNIITMRDDLFSNWTLGARIESAKSMFEEFINVSDKYDSFIINAIDNLEIATRNISIVG